MLSATVANTWFFERRGLVTGILGGAASAGQLVFILLLAEIVDVWGWRQAVGLMAALAALIVLPLAVLVAKQASRCRARRLRFVARPTAARRGRTARADEGSAQDGRLLAYRPELRRLWIHHHRAGRHALHPACDRTRIHRETGRGHPQGRFGAFNVVGTIASGWLTDRYSARKLLALYYALRGSRSWSCQPSRPSR